LFIDELVEISAVAKFHDYVEFLPLDDRLAVRDYIDVLELLEQLHLIEYVIGLLLVLIGEFDLFYHIVFIFGQMAGQVGVAECSKLMISYPCPIIFKILYWCI
jgi:hypothetical protein